MNIAIILSTLASICSAITVILTFLGRGKKTVDVAINKNFEKVLEPILKPIKDDLQNIKEDIVRLDKNECKNYLTEFLEDMKKGVEKTDIEKQRATEVYDHYSNDLHLNSYIHSEWDKLMN